MTTAQEASDAPSRDDKIQRALLRAFVDKNYEKYQKKWDKAASKKSKQSWNWAAFIFSLGWFAYRKMYVSATIWISLIILETVASMVFGYPEKYSRLFTLGLAFAAGQVGNTIYGEHAKKQIARVKESLPSSDWVSALRSKGGTSWLAGIGAFIACLVLLFVVFAVGGEL